MGVRSWRRTIVAGVVDELKIHLQTYVEETVHVHEWHHHPIVSWVMCQLGRHDFEVDVVHADGATLVCLRCQRLRFGRGR